MAAMTRQVIHQDQLTSALCAQLFIGGGGGGAGVLVYASLGCAAYAHW